MAYTMALAGKGGTGKTTMAALVVRALREAGAPSILAVDADPNATLHEALGVDVERSVGELTEQMLASVESLPAGMTKRDWIEYNIQRYVVETPEFDLLEMGRPEGAGCYCYANSLVRECVDSLSGSYEYVVMDNEAGLEHLSRRTTRNVDVLLLVSDPSLRGTRTAARLSELADELSIGVGARYVVYNRAAAPLDPALTAAAEEHGLEIAGVVPDDPGIGACDLAGTGLFDLDDDSTALAAVKDMLATVAPRARAQAG
jgi:CO dehydrogenase maturation factor